MAETHDTYKKILENLIDAGCDESIIAKCMRLVKDGRKLEIFPILTEHRKYLLDSVHKGQKQIDCLDYLLYSLKKQC